jgi:hypothetical protein
VKYIITEVAKHMPSMRNEFELQALPLMPLRVQAGYLVERRKGKLGFRVWTTTEYYVAVNAKLYCYSDAKCKPPATKEWDLREHSVLPRINNNSLAAQGFALGSQEPWLAAPEDVLKRKLMLAADYMSQHHSSGWIMQLQQQLHRAEGAKLPYRDWVKQLERECAGNSKGSAKGGISVGGTWSEAAQAHLGKYKKRMQKETASAESAGKDEDAIIAHVEPLLREEMRRDSLTEKTAEELIKRLVEDYQCESGGESDEEDGEADEPGSGGASKGGASKGGASKGDASRGCGRPSQSVPESSEDEDEDELQLSPVLLLLSRRSQLVHQRVVKALQTQLLHLKLKRAELLRHPVITAEAAVREREAIANWMWQSL